jgi:hypothetical protein
MSDFRGEATRQMKLLTAYYVLSAISNDYEKLAMVVEEVLKWAREDGMELTDEEVVGTLQMLVAKGYAQAYVKHPERLPTAEILPAKDARRFYFFVTPTGKRLVTDMDNVS